MDWRRKKVALPRENVETHCTRISDVGKGKEQEEAEADNAR